MAEAGQVTAATIVALSTVFLRPITIIELQKKEFGCGEREDMAVVEVMEEDAEDGIEWR